MNTIYTNLIRAAQNHRLADLIEWCAVPGGVVRAQYRNIGAKYEVTQKRDGEATNIRKIEPHQGEPALMRDGAINQTAPANFHPQPNRGAMLCAVWFFFSAIGVGSILFFMAIRVWIKAKGVM